jgi:DNA-binding FadR family transcriptional regulator
MPMAVRAKVSNMLCAASFSTWSASSGSASLHDGVATRLRNWSSTANWRRASGPRRIDEKALAEAWQISRTPLREALKVLASEGLVELVPHRGCRVIELTDADADTCSR